MAASRTSSIAVVEGVGNKNAIVLHCVSKNRTPGIFSNISNKSGPISIIFGTDNR